MNTHQVGVSNARAWRDQGTSTPSTGRQNGCSVRTAKSTSTALDRDIVGDLRVVSHHHRPPCVVDMDCGLTAQACWPPAASAPMGNGELIDCS
jgi:hypothetical protein